MSQLTNPFQLFNGLLCIINIREQLKLSMGNEFCNETGIDKDIDRSQLNDGDDQANNAKNQTNKQVEPPHGAIAIKLDDIPHNEPSAAELTKLQERITKIMKNEKSNHLKLKISKAPNELQQLKDSYLLTQSKNIYIGQWVYNSDYNSSVPGGIGRLYTDNQILEGQFQTKPVGSLADDKIQSKYKETDVTQRFVRSKEEKQFFGVDLKSSAAYEEENFRANQHKKRLDYISHQENAKKIIVTLEGEGRIFSRQKQLAGIFKNNLLNGKGIYRFRQNDTTYSYDGIFKDGRKHGKGQQKIGKLVIYDGDFVDDKKEGSGVLTLHLSQTYIKQRQKQEKSLQLEEKQVNQNLKIKKVSQYLTKVQEYQLKIQYYLQQANIKWKGPSAPKTIKSFRSDEWFFIDSIQRTKFLEQYKGQFINNQFSGIGTYTWFNGKCYQGQWKNGKMHGYGQFYWPDGTYYRGQYQDDLRHGKGEMIFSFEKRFRGNFVFGLKHGYGELITVKLIREPKVETKEQEKVIIKQIVNLRVKGSIYQNDKQAPNASTEYKQFYYDLDIKEAMSQLKSKQHEEIILNLHELRQLKTKTEQIVKNLLKPKNKQLQY